MSIEREKQLAAEAAAGLVKDGMTVGLGTGSTVAFLLPALAARKLAIRCVATSVHTRQRATELGLDVELVDTLDHLDVAIDGADQVTPEGWLIKGGGGAHTREKIVAASAARFVVIGDSTKPVKALRPPVPLELLAFGLPATLRELGQAVVRQGWPLSPDGGIIADYNGPIGDPAELAARLSATPGVVGHGLFEPALTADVFIATGDSVEHRVLHS
ncbi:MAG TPA: ribose 5-phosphate isomerase A [Streptosporangiaceae bacterium]|nr:ribose 5-phosphate isomerase A [Streptosporangiaceae bacterium]